jgi:hypothetical protein
MSVRILTAITIAVVGTLLWLAAPAIAHHTDQADPNDTRGTMDVEAVRFNHQGKPTWRFVTFGDWTVRRIWDRGYLIVQLDTRGDQRVDFVAVVRSIGRGLQATLFRLRRDGQEVQIDRLRTEKAGSDGAWVSVSLRKLTIGSSRTSYFWSALSSFTGPTCRQTCFDAVPNRGMIEQPLVSESPSPSPSPSHSPSPSPSPSPAPTGPTG